MKVPGSDRPRVGRVAGSRRITGRQRPSSEPVVDVPPPADAPAGRPAGSSAGKGRPTPKRSESQQRRGGPVAPPPKTRKEASKRTKERATAERAETRAGTGRSTGRTTGRPMLARDEGPVRRLVRDVVDARRNVGVLLLPLAVVLLVAQASNSPRLESFAVLLWLAGVLAMLADVVVTTTLIRRRVQQAHPGTGGMRGHVGYGLLRSTVFRRFRTPPPQVSPGRVPAG